MNTSEGLMRVALVVRWVGYLLAAATVVLASIAATEVWVSGVLGVALVAAFFAGSGWAVAWIIEGFAKPKA